ncbi:MAG TPA: hypothetical protein VFV67_04860 [Actinophytocola sp.]|uniref:hypothetical protein n=1 Tax=Actinophytocola sp. TaxID=1872138 RepID=UPI002DBA0467|nr:hypothetical protein [Actinophytocola sp.]HEU5469961.1 hypothetical protein [Actinophytocola sp.]
MVEDAAQRYGDLSVLITTDTDLTPAINATAEIAPDRPIYLACPAGRQPPQVRRPPSVTSFLIGRRQLAASLLPARVVGSKGQIHERPDKWR